MACTHHDTTSQTQTLMRSPCTPGKAPPLNYGDTAHVLSQVRGALLGRSEQGTSAAFRIDLDPAAGEPRERDRTEPPTPRPIASSCEPHRDEWTACSSIASIIAERGCRCTWLEGLCDSFGDSARGSSGGVRNGSRGARIGVSSTSLVSAHFLSAAMACGGSPLAGLGRSFRSSGSR